MSTICADEISVSYREQAVLTNLSCQLPTGKITTIIGSNGCGKSTLLKSLTRILPVQSGSVLLDGQDIATLPTKEVAKKIALLPQLVDSPQGISVYDLVSYGRFPHQKGWGRLSETDREKIDWAMKATDTASLAHQAVDSLSGGQRQRVWIAMALAQDTETIFLDEPTTYLDMNHQLEILELLTELNHAFQKTIVMVLHDINLAARFSHHLIAMKKGTIHYTGSVNEVMCARVLRDIFQIEAQIISDPKKGIPILLTYQLVK